MALRFGIIGCGMIGQLYASRLREQGHALVAASDPDLERARRVAPAAYTDYRAMMGEQELDVACVCSPTPHHYEAVMDAAAAGVDVFLEKPMSMTLAQAREMSVAMARAGRRIGFGLKMRFEAIFSAAHALVREGAIGAPQFATYSFYQPIPPGERIWYADIGVLRDMLVHIFDLSIWMHGQEPHAVRARTARRIGRAGEDHASVEIDLPNDARITVQGGYMPGFPEIAGREDIVFQVVGERGYLVGKRPDTLILVDRRGMQTIPIVPIDAFAAELAAFTAARQANAALPVSDRDGLRAQSVIDAAERSARAGGASVLLMPSNLELSAPALA